MAFNLRTRPGGLATVLPAPGAGAKLIAAIAGNYPPSDIGYTGCMRRFERITIDPEVMGGKPCIRGMRVTVGMIVEALGAGRTVQELLVDFPYLEDADIRESLGFAAQLEIFWRTGSQKLAK